MIIPIIIISNIKTLKTLIRVIAVFSSRIFHESSNKKKNYSFLKDLGFAETFETILVANAVRFWSKGSATDLCDFLSSFLS